MAGWLMNTRFAARVTCRSSNSAWRAYSRLKSTCFKSTSRMRHMLTMHWTNNNLVCIY